MTGLKIKKKSYVIRLNSGVCEKEFLSYKSGSYCVHTRLCHHHNTAQSCSNGWCPEHQMSVVVTHFKSSQVKSSQVKSSRPFPVKPRRNMGHPRSNVSRLCFQLSLWPLSISFPLFQLPPMSFSSSSFSALVLCLVLRGSKWNFTSLW